MRTKEISAVNIIVMTNPTDKFIFGWIKKWAELKHKSNALINSPNSITLTTNKPIKVTVK